MLQALALCLLLLPVNAQAADSILLAQSTAAKKSKEAKPGTKKKPETKTEKKAESKTKAAEAKKTRPDTRNFCTFDRQNYRPGATACRRGEKWRCRDSGQWINLKEKC